MTAVAPDAVFYHLERQPLERVLPTLVEKTVERGWRAVIQAGTIEGMAVLDAALWTYQEESFLPHGTAADGPSARQPVFLTTTNDNPNGATIRFLVDGAVATSYTGYQRLIFMFDGRNPDAVAAARLQWKAAKSAGCAVTYWQQTPEGKWDRRA